MARLITYVHCYRDGQAHVFGPGDDVPEWARRQITRPELWHGGHVDLPEPQEIILVGSGGGGGARASSGSADAPPPQGGTGATRQRWADYATSKGVKVQDDWKREDIIDACEKAGIEV